jgi:hypothetical protein
MYHDSTLSEVDSLNFEEVERYTQILNFYTGTIKNCVSPAVVVILWYDMQRSDMGWNGSTF